MHSPSSHTLEWISTSRRAGIQFAPDQVPLFAGLGRGELDAITRLAPVKAYPRGTIIIPHRSDAQALYIIVEGKVKVYLTTDEGKEIVLRAESTGEYFGELSLLDDAPASASVMALESCQCAVLAKQSFTRLCEDYPAIRDHLLKGLSLRVRQLTDEVCSLALLDVYQRIARTLHSLAAWQGDELAVERLTHQAIADRVCASREMVSRILKDLNAGGYLKFEKNRIVIVRKLPASW